jgi:predicted hydrocarbon binding protein
MTSEQNGTERLVGVGAQAFHKLRIALENHLGDDAATFLQAAGFASGESIYANFISWLADSSGVADPTELDANFLNEMLSGYFSEIGWGKLALEQVGPAGMVMASGDWAEADSSAVVEFPSCHVTTGMLADFMSRMAGETVAVMEVECRSRNDERCAFLIGSPDTLQAVYDLIREGKDYRTALAG